MSKNLWKIKNWLEIEQKRQNSQRLFHMQAKNKIKNIQQAIDLQNRQIWELSEANLIRGRTQEKEYDNQQFCSVPSKTY